PVRQRGEAVRSLNPTHSVAGIGPRVIELTRDHVDSVSPCDGSSPFARLAGLHDGYVLLLGVDHESNTAFHHVEELVGTDYHLQRELARAIIKLGSTTLEREVLMHRYGTPRRFMVVDELLTERGAQTIGHVGAADTRLVRVSSMVSIAAEALRANARLFVGTRAHKEKTWARSRSRA